MTKIISKKQADGTIKRFIKIKKRNEMLINYKTEADSNKSPDLKQNLSRGGRNIRSVYGKSIL